jgi:cation diffusion facilitator CzcD-associated flavoprotein CzcO
LFVSNQFIEFLQIKMRICVIGAGAAGICAARRVQEDAIKNGILNMEIRIFEQSNQLGGTWVFDEAFGAHSSMYSNLR